MSPDLVVLGRLIWTALSEKVLEKAHVLQTEEGDLVVRLRRIFSHGSSQGLSSERKFVREVAAGLT